jgi:hypothetical protein
MREEEKAEVRMQRQSSIGRIIMMTGKPFDKHCIIVISFSNEVFIIRVEGRC